MSNYRSEKLLAAVRKLPCALCGAPAPSEASHGNVEIDQGKDLSKLEGQRTQRRVDRKTRLTLCA